MPTGICADLGIADRYELIRKASLRLVLSILALQCLWRSTVIAILAWSIPFWVTIFPPDMSSWSPSWVARSLRSRSEQVVSIFSRDVLWLARFPYTSVGIYKADRHTVNDETAGDAVPKDVEVPPINVHDMKNISLLLQDDAGWTQNVGSFDVCLFKSRGSIEVKSWVLSWRSRVPSLRSTMSVTCCNRLLLLCALVLGWPNPVPVKHRRCARLLKRSCHVLVTLQLRWLSSASGRRYPTYLCGSWR